MHRQNLINKLHVYSPESEEEKGFRASFLAFIKSNNDCFERTLVEGHITGSAWIVNKSRSKALLTHHRKLNRWLQPGGHADGDPDIIQVATNEAIEESGLTMVKLVSTAIFDIDIHTIPPFRNDPRHLHYDVRFLFEADDKAPLTISNESKDLAWVPLNKLGQFIDSNDSILRMARKLEARS